MRLPEPVLVSPFDKPNRITPVNPRDRLTRALPFPLTRRTCAIPALSDDGPIDWPCHPGSTHETLLPSPHHMTSLLVPGSSTRRIGSRRAISIDWSTHVPPFHTTRLVNPSLLVTIQARPNHLTAHFTPDLLARPSAPQQIAST